MKATLCYHRTQVNEEETCDDTLLGIHEKLTLEEAGKHLKAYPTMSGRCYVMLSPSCAHFSVCLEDKTSYDREDLSYTNVELTAMEELMSFVR